MPTEASPNISRNRRIARVSAMIAEQIGLTPEEVANLHHAVLIHDVGKAGVKVLATTKSPVLRMAADIARSSHERWDGIGFPDALAGQSIPLVARIVAVADEYDLLTHHVPGHMGWDVDRALASLDAQAGFRFDPFVVRTFKAMVLRSLQAHELPRLPRLATYAA